MFFNSFLLNSVERFALLKNCNNSSFFFIWKLNNGIIVCVWLLLLNNSYTRLYFCDNILQLMLHDIDKENLSKRTYFEIFFFKFRSKMVNTSILVKACIFVFLLHGFISTFGLWLVFIWLILIFEKKKYCIFFFGKRISLIQVHIWAFLLFHLLIISLPPIDETASL